MNMSDDCYASYKNCFLRSNWQFGEKNICLGLLRRSLVWSMAPVCSSRLTVFLESDNTAAFKEFQSISWTPKSHLAKWFNCMFHLVFLYACLAFQWFILPWKSNFVRYVRLNNGNLLKEVWLDHAVAIKKNTLAWFRGH